MRLPCWTHTRPQLYVLSAERGNKSVDEGADIHGRHDGGLWWVMCLDVCVCVFLEEW